MEPKASRQQLGAAVAAAVGSGSWHSSFHLTVCQLYNCCDLQHHCDVEVDSSTRFGRIAIAILCGSVRCRISRREADADEQSLGPGW